MFSRKFSSFFKLFPIISMYQPLKQFKKIRVLPSEWLEIF